MLSSIINSIQGLSLTFRRNYVIINVDTSDSQITGIYYQKPKNPKYVKPYKKNYRKIE